MLAQLLRSLLLSQALIGIGVGYHIHSNYSASLQWIIVFILGLPLLGVACSCIFSACKSYPGGSLVLWLKALVGEYVTNVQFMMLQLPWAFRPPVFLQANSNQNKIPVVLVHGYLCNYRIWTKVIQALTNAGHGVMPVNLEPVFASIDKYPSIIEAAVHQACLESGASKVILVGHSMGGIAIRAWIRDHGTSKIAGVVTLGSPHQGTQLARNAIGTNARQMYWQSSWMQELAATESEAIRSLFRIAITKQDNIVFPQQAQVLPGIQAQLFEGIGHLEMCLHPPVVQWVIRQVLEIEQGKQGHDTH